MSQPAQGATKTFSNTAGAWLTGGNWTPAGVPDSTNDVLISGGTTAMTLTASNMTIQWLTSTNTSSRILENATGGATPSNLTLSLVDGNGNLINVNPASGSPTFTIRNGSTAALNVVLGSSGNFNVASVGSLSISSTISDGGNSYNLTKTGAGRLRLGAANTYGGVTTLNGGTTFIDTASAFGIAASNVQVGDTTGSNFAELNIATGGVTISRNITVRSGSSGNAFLSYGLAAGTGTYSGAVTLNKNGVLGAGGGTVRFTNTISGPGSLIVSNFGTGAGNVLLSGANNYTGGTGVFAGTLQFGAANSLPSNGLVQIGASNGTTGSLSLNGFNQAIGALTIVAPSADKTSIILGANTLAISGNINLVDNTSAPGNAFKTTISSDTGGGIDLGGAVRQLNVAAQNLTASNTVAELIVNAPITNGGLTYNGTPSTFNGAPASVIFGGANTFTGGLTINQGSITVVSGATLGGNTQTLALNATGVAVNSSGLVLNASQTVSSFSGSVSGSAVATLTLSGVLTKLTVDQATDTTYAGTITGTGGLTKTGAGKLTLTNSSNYTGANIVNGGRLVAVANNALGTVGGATTVNVSGSLGFSSNVSYATAEPVSINGTGVSAAGAIENLGGTNSFAGPVTMQSNSSIGVTAGQLTLNGNITGGFIFTKVGPGILDLTRATGNTYTGGTQINGGVLRVNNTSGSATGTGAVAVNSTGTLGGSGIITGALTLNSGATIAPGNSVGQINTGAETWAGGGNYEWEINDATGTQGVDPGWDHIQMSSLVINATPGNKFTLRVKSLPAGNAPANFAGSPPGPGYYRWVIATATGGVSGFNAQAFNIDYSGFTGVASGGHFILALETANTQLALYYVPEPGAATIVVTGAATTLPRRPRRRPRSPDRVQ